MKKLSNLTIIFTIILSLTFIPAIQTNAAAKVNITYYANNGYFKAKPNRNKSKITIKNKISHLCDFLKYIHNHKLQFFSF